MARLAQAAAALLLRLVDAVIALTVFGLFALVASQSFDRNVLPLWRHSPEEYVKVGLVWLCFLGFARVYAAGETIRIEFLHAAVSPRARRVLDTAFDLLAVAVLSVIVLKGMVFLRVASMQTILGTDMTLAVPGLGLVIGAVLMLAAAVVRIVRRLVLPVA